MRFSATIYRLHHIGVITSGVNPVRGLEQGG
jgi:hypothetical protein